MHDPPTTDLGNLQVCRILNGMWQVSGAHGAIDPARAIDSMVRHHDAGLTTWDLADHYGPAEDFVGRFRSRLVAERGADAVGDVVALTKWVPQPGFVPRPLVETAIGRSLRRMGVESLDLLQFHWWDYEDDNYLDALQSLSELQAEGKICNLGLTNFDTARLDQILQVGHKVVSNQVQLSLVDQRPLQRMLPLCRETGVKLLAYGTLCGGLLSEKYLDQPEPPGSLLNTASLRKYKQMIDVWGGWSLFQELLRVLDQIARNHDASIANVAVSEALRDPHVAGVIVGVRLGESDHISDNLRAFDLVLEEREVEALHAVTARGNDLMILIGDCGDEYRH